MIIDSVDRARSECEAPKGRPNHGRLPRRFNVLFGFGMIWWRSIGCDLRITLRADGAVVEGLHVARSWNDVEQVRNIWRSPVITTMA
jgi:hypothetical protein